MATNPVAVAATSVLVWGFRVAAALLLAGTAISLIRQQPLTHELPGFSDVLRDIGRLDGTGFFGLGIYAIILTPVITTLAIALAFLRIGDRRFAIWTGSVLAILAISVAWSLR